MRFDLAAATIIGAASASAQSPAITAPSYVATAAASDLYELQSSRLVLSDAKNTGIRRFAQMMIVDHMATTQKIQNAAVSAGISVPPPKLMPKQQMMIDALSKASGGQRESLYVDQQIKAHQEALALHRSYATSGDTPALRKVAADAVPIIEHHLSMAQDMSRKTS